MTNQSNTRAAANTSANTGGDAVVCIPFTRRAKELPDTPHYSSSYGGQWSSDWCVGVTVDGRIQPTKLVLSASAKEALTNGEMPSSDWPFVNWKNHAAESVVAWAYVADVRAALAAQPTPEPVAQADVPYAKHEKDLLEQVDETERCREWADKLSEAIAMHFGIDIGEHSSANNPWAVALDIFNQRAAPSPVALQGRDDFERLIDEGVIYLPTIMRRDHTPDSIERMMRDAAESAWQAARASLPAGGVVGYMNPGHVHELRMGRANYGYVYPKAEVGASVPVYATPQPSETQGRRQMTDETAWLIEWPMPDGAAPAYWTGGELEPKATKQRVADFDRDSLKAVRFSRKEDAEKVLDYLCSIRLVRVDLFEEMDRKKLDERPGKGYIDTLVKNGFINVKKDYRVVGARELYRVTEHMWPEAARASLPADHRVSELEAEVAREKTRFTNLALDIHRVLNWEKPLNDFEEVKELQAFVSAQASLPAGGVVEPSDTQLQQILDGLNRCHVSASRAEFLRTWIRNWTQHKIAQSTATPQPSETQGRGQMTDEMLKVLKGCRDTAMAKAASARVPECGDFGGIAQDLDWLVAELCPASPQDGGEKA